MTPHTRALLMFGIGPIELLIVLIMGLLFFVTPAAVLIFLFIRHRNNREEQDRVQRKLVEDLLEENRRLHEDIRRLQANGPRTQ